SSRARPHGRAVHCAPVALFPSRNAVTTRRRVFAARHELPRRDTLRRMSDEGMTPSERTEQLRRQLEADATEWSQRADQRADAGLLDEGQLGELDAWLTPAARRDIAVSDVAESFIAASRAARR